MLFEVMAVSPPGDWPMAWIDAVARGLADRDSAVAAQAVIAARAANRPALLEPLLALARDATQPRDLRTMALEAASSRLGGIESPLFDFLVSRLDPHAEPLARLSASRTLGRAALNTAQLMTLSSAVAGAGALILPNLLTTFERSREAGVGAALVTALGKAPGLTALTPTALRKALRNYPHSIRRRAGRLIRRLDKSSSEQAKRLAEMLPLVEKGDAVRGREIFFGPRVACSTCHTVRGEGAQVGPDLTRIGAARNRRDLLEAVLFPSATFARGYQPMLVATDDGRVFSGVVVRETGEAIILVTADRTELSVPRQSIATIEPDPVSVMPQGLDANLSHSELADLIAFLCCLR
jgi:putative heme-binding domain-containing protein